MAGVPAEASANLIRLVSLYLANKNPVRGSMRMRADTAFGATTIGAAYRQPSEDKCALCALAIRRVINNDAKITKMGL